MWKKLYVLIIVLVIILILQYVQYGIKYLNKIYDIENKYYMPVSCMSNSLCGMSGTILFFLTIYMLVPSEIFENITDMLSPQQLNKLSDNSERIINNVYDNIPLLRKK